MRVCKTAQNRGIHPETNRILWLPYAALSGMRTLIVQDDI
jgi:hypothetical protein